MNEQMQDDTMLIIEQRMCGIDSRYDISRAGVKMYTSTLENKDTSLRDRR